MTNKKTMRKCIKGHLYFKSSDCPICPVCEESRKSETNIFASLSAPARRALEYNNIDTLQKLSEFSETEILQLHGIGKTSIPKLVELLKTKELKFKAIRK